MCWGGGGNCHWCSQWWSSLSFAMVGRVGMVVAVVCGGGGGQRRQWLSPCWCGGWRERREVECAALMLVSSGERVAVLTNAVRVGCGGRHGREVWSKGRLAARVSVVVCRCASSTACVHAVVVADMRERWRGGDRRQADSTGCRACVRAVVVVDARERRGGGCTAS